MTKKILAVSQLFLAFFLWSTLAIFFNRTTLPSIVYVSTGSILALMLLSIFLVRRQQKLHLPRNWASVGIFLAAAIKGIIWFRTLQIYPVAQAMILHNLAPSVAVILSSLILKDRPQARQLLAIPLGLAGLILLLDVTQLNLSLGFFFAIITACCSGFQDVCHRRLASSVPSHTQTYLFILGQASSTTLLTLPHLSQVTLSDLAPITYFALAGTLIPSLILAHSFITLKAYEVAILGYLEPLMGATWGVLFLHQSLNLPTVVGGALIFFAGLIILLPPQNHDPQSKIKHH